MKKSLLALAAVGAFAGAAQAQSSVTVYGIIDMSFQGRSTTISNLKTNSTNFNGDGSESTSRLGFRGTEDLGGGMSAFFTSEFQLYPTNANLSGDNNGGLFNRQTFVGLKKNGIGQFAMGTQYTPIHLAVSRNDPGQQNNMLGDVIYTTNAAQGNATTTTSYTVRQNQSLTAATDRFAGFVVSGMYVNGNQSTSNGGTNNSFGYALAVNYVWNKLNVDAAWQQFKNETSVAGVLTPAALPTNPSRAAIGTTTTNGLNITDSQYYGGASYDFGILKAYAQYVNRKATSNINSNQYVKRSAQNIGVRGNITKTVEGWAMVGNGSYTAFGTGSPTANFTGWQVGSNYWLSKRTNMYAIYGATQTSSTSSAPKASGSSYAVGVRHTF